MNRPALGVIKKGEQIKIDEVLDVGGGFIWARFSSVAPLTVQGNPSSIAYCVVGSYKDKKNAIDHAQNLATKGYKAEVYPSPNGFYGVTIGSWPVDEAKIQLQKARKKGDAPRDSYLSRRERKIQNRVYPGG